MNIEQLFLDCNSNTLGGRKILFTPVKSPVESASYLRTADSYQFTSSADGTLSASVVASLYKVEINNPKPETDFYLNVSEYSASLYSGSVRTGSAQFVYFYLFDLIKDTTRISKLTLTPQWTYPFNFSGSIVALCSTASYPTTGGYAEYDNLVPGVYQCDALGKVTTTFYISVPAWESSDISGQWNAKDLLVVKPTKGTKVGVNNADNSYVLTVSASDARYWPIVGGIPVPDTASWAITANTALTAISASYVSGSGYADSAISASWASSSVNADHSINSTYAASASWVSGSGYADNAISASWASSSISSSHALLADSGRDPYIFVNPAVNPTIVGLKSPDGGVFIDALEDPSIPANVYNNVVRIFDTYGDLQAFVTNSGIVVNSGLYIGSITGSPDTYVKIAASSPTGGYVAIQSQKNATTAGNIVLNKDGGYVGIGTDAITNSLDVSGNISCSVITASLFFGTASHAETATLAQFVTNQVSQSVSSSAAVSASYSKTASLALGLPADLTQFGGDMEFVGHAPGYPDILRTGAGGLPWFNGSGDIFARNVYGTASLSITSSYASNSNTASYSVTASHALNSPTASVSITSSYSLNANSSSFASASSISVTSSYSLNANSSSFSNTSSFSLNSNTASYSTIASSSLITFTSDAGSHYLTFITSAVTDPDVADLRVNSAINVFPNGGILQATAFYGKVTGSVLGNVTGNISGTASYSNTASYALNAIPVVSSSWASASISSSYAATSSYAMNAVSTSSLARTASYVQTPIANGGAWNIYISGSGDLIFTFV